MHDKYFSTVAQSAFWWVKWDTSCCIKYWVGLDSYHLTGKPEWTFWPPPVIPSVKVQLCLPAATGRKKLQCCSESSLPTVQHAGSKAEHFKDMIRWENTKLEVTSPSLSGRENAALFGLRSWEGAKAVQTAGPRQLSATLEPLHLPNLSGACFLPRTRN